jgi:aminoglycoside 6-adenylyltransferase
MEDSIGSIKQFENRVTAWAETQANIRTILVVGSRARCDHPGDVWADLDLMLFATDFAAYLARTEWLDEIGLVWVCVPQQTGAGDPELLVLFDGGYKVDFVFYPMAELERLTQASSLPNVYRRGYYTLVDKDGRAARLPAPSFQPLPSTPPMDNVFLLTVNSFWYGAVYVAKQIRRRELWVVKVRDWTTKEFLLTMLEWHARSRHGWTYDTWHDGRFLSAWSDPPIWTALHDTFGHFDAPDSWRALLATMDLFRRLATETAASLGYVYPTPLDERVTEFVRTLYAGDGSLVQ